MLEYYQFHFLSFLGAVFLPYFSVGAVVVATFSEATATGVNNPCLLWVSVAFKAPLSVSCLKSVRAIDPTTLNFSTTWETETCFPSLGIPVSNL